MQIAVAQHLFPGKVIKFIKIIHFEFFKIDLDVCLKIKVFIVRGFIKIRLGYCVLVDDFLAVVQELKAFQLVAL